jgi:hypothetical protein
MGQLFVLYRLTVQVRRFGGVIDEHPTWVLADEAEKVWNPFLQAYNMDAGWQMERLSHSFRDNGITPWLIIALQEQLPITGYLLSLRESFTDFQLASYNREHAEGERPATGMIIFSSEEMLARYEGACPAFQAARKEIARSHQVDGWFYLADPLSKGWLDKCSKEDMRLSTDAQKEKKLRSE